MRFFNPEHVQIQSWRLFFILWPNTQAGVPGLRLWGVSVQFDRERSGKVRILWAFPSVASGRCSGTSPTQHLWGIELATARVKLCFWSFLQVNSVINLLFAAFTGDVTALRRWLHSHFCISPPLKTKHHLCELFPIFVTLFDYQIWHWTSAWSQL